MMTTTLHRIALALFTGLALSTTAAAAPVGIGIAFQAGTGNGQWSAGQGLQLYTGSAQVNVGAVNQRNALYYVQEAEVEGLQSWYLFFDPSSRQRVRGTIDFGAPVVDIFSTRAELRASQAIYGVDIDGDGVLDDYGSSLLMGLESGDLLSWSAGSPTLTIEWLAADPGDHVRVLVRAAQADPQDDANAVPEPGALALALMALAGAGVARRSRAIPKA